MIKNYLRSAFRNIKRHLFISFINIFGLTVGLTCCLLIIAYVVNERSYDKFNKNANEIYRVTRTFYTSPGVESLHLPCVAPPFGPLLKSAFPDIKEITRVLHNPAALKYNDKLFNEENTFMADENFFDFFSVPVVKGDPKKGLDDPFSIMLTEEAAKKYFGSEDPMNKIIQLDNIKKGFRVTGIFKAFPANSHLHPEILMSFNTLKDSTIYGEKSLQTDFGGNAFFTFLLLPKGYNINRMSSQLPDFLDHYVNLGGGTAGNQKTHLLTSLSLQKMTDIHLRSHLADEIEAPGDITRVYVFSAIALFILLIACINYMNLSTARSALRAKEIGIRKVIGAQRKEIISQFLSESVLITWFALILALVLTSICIPLVNQMSSQHLDFNSLLNWNILIPILLMPFVIGIISGIYPALFMSSFLPIKVLKGIVKAGHDGISFRKILVVLQFSISIILIVATTVVFQQLQYVQSKALGFNKENIVTINFPASLNKQFTAFREDLKRNNLINNVAWSSRIPSGRLLDYQGYKLLDSAGASNPNKVDLKCVSVDYDFVPTYNMEMAAGRNYSKAYSADSNDYIINEKSVRDFGWKNADFAIGKNIQYSGVTGKIIGVVKDFHFESLHERITPILFRFRADKYINNGKLSIKVDGKKSSAAIVAIQQAWHNYIPDTPFDFTFLDQKFDQLYKADQQQGSLFTVFSFIAIFIACLGLFGLSAFTISQRVKEIGVRKVLGASIPQIVIELSKDFLKLVVVASIIALPCAFVLMNKWLRDFAFRINISWWVLALAGITALIIAFVTISIQSVKAALANPVKSLRSE